MIANLLVFLLIIGLIVLFGWLTYRAFRAKKLWIKIVGGIGAGLEESQFNKPPPSITQPVKSRFCAPVAASSHPRCLLALRRPLVRGPTVWAAPLPKDACNAQYDHYRRARLGAQANSVAWQIQWPRTTTRAMACSMSGLAWRPAAAAAFTGSTPTARPRRLPAGDRPAGVLVDPADGDIFTSEDYGGCHYRSAFGGTGRSHLGERLRRWRR